MNGGVRRGLMYLPALLLLAVFFGGGVALGLEGALRNGGRWSLDAFRAVFSDPELWASFVFTLRFSLISSLISSVLAVLCACAVFVNPAGLKLAGRICAVPVSVPHVIASLLIFTLLSGTGLPSRVAGQWGGRVPPLVMDRGGWGVILAYCWKGFPFTLITLISVVKVFDRRVYEAARTLGASHRQALLRVFVPALWRPAFTCFSMLFAYSFGAFEIPWILGPTSPRALAVKAWNLFTQSNFTGQPGALALACVISGLSLCCCAFSESSERKVKK